MNLRPIHATAKRSKNKTPGRAAHHGSQSTNINLSAVPHRFAFRRRLMLNPVGVGGHCCKYYPGCAARPRALLLNAFGVDRPTTAKRSNSTARGRAAHPEDRDVDCAPNPNGGSTLLPNETFVYFDTVYFTQAAKLILKRFFPMMFFLIPDVVRQCVDMRWTD